MHVRWLELTGFRNYASLSFAPDPGLNVLVGPNGHGKTSLLEALHVLLTGRSFRTPRLGECIGWDAAERARLAGEVVDASRAREVRLELVARRPGGELQGTLCAWARAVTFAAGDLALVTGLPQARRAYLDGATVKLWPAHGEMGRRYRLVLQQRGRLLEQLAGRPDAERLLGPWDEQLAALGAEVLHRRLEGLAALGAEAQEVRRALAPGGAPLEIRYVASVDPGGDVASTRARLLEALGAGRARDLRRGLTLAGPHRDDVLVKLGRADARISASRGEQRLLALTLRLAEAGALRRRLGASPVFLLDDLLSELDRGARARVLEWLAGQGQVVFSGTDAIAVPGAGMCQWDVQNADVSALAASARGVA